MSINSENVLLYFWNSSCSVCGPLYTKLEDLIGQDFPQLSLERVDIVKEPELRAKYSVFTSPLILLLIDGKEYFRSGGNVSIHELKQKIERLYSLRFAGEG